MKSLVPTCNELKRVKFQTKRRCVCKSFTFSSDKKGFTLLRNVKHQFSFDLFNFCVSENLLFSLTTLSNVQGKVVRNLVIANTMCCIVFLEFYCVLNSIKPIEQTMHIWFAKSCLGMQIFCTWLYTVRNPSNSLGFYVCTYIRYNSNV